MNNSYYDWTKLFGVPSATTGAPSTAGPTTQYINSGGNSQLLNLISGLFSSGSGLIGRPGRQLNINGVESNSNFADGDVNLFGPNAPTAATRANVEQARLGQPGATGNILAGIPFQQNPVQLAQFQRQAQQANIPATNPDGQGVTLPNYTYDSQSRSHPINVPIGPTTNPTAPTAVASKKPAQPLDLYKIFGFDRV